MSQTRRSQILEAIRSQGFASLPTLADALGVSESTIRRDLAHLEKEGSAKRTHGGAFYTGPAPQLTHFRQRQSAEWDKKKAIAVAALPLICDVDTLLLDGGSTTYELARLIANRPLQIVTNSLPVANLFSSQADVDLIIIGGYVHSSSGVIHGAYADEMLKALRVRTSVLSAAGVSEDGVYNNNHMLAATQLAMANAADEVVLLADSTKFGRRSLAKIGGLDAIDRLVVDHRISDKWTKMAESAGIEVVVAEPPESGEAGSPRADATRANPQPKSKA